MNEVAMVSPVSPGSAKIPKFDTSKLSGEHKQLLDETLAIMQKDKFSASMLSKVAELGTPVTFGNDGLSGGQAAGTKISSTGKSEVALGTQAIDKAKTKTDKMKAIGGMIGNEFHSVIFGAQAAKSGKSTSSMQSKVHEGASFHTDGYNQALIEKSVNGGGANTEVTFKDAKAQVEKEYGTSIQNVLNKAGSYAKLPGGDISASGLDELAKDGVLPEDFVQEAKQDLAATVSGGGGAAAGANAKTGRMAKVSFDALQAEGITKGSERQDSSIPPLAPKTAKKPEEGKGDLTLTS
jgi:hypothetical protein